jgi:hypothetical protein
MAADMALIVIVKVEAMKGYWHQPAQAGSEPSFGTDLTPASMVDYSVTRGIKGATTSGWLQEWQYGANPADVPCGAAVALFPDNPLPVVGPTYVLVIRSAEGTSQVGAESRYEIRGGRVYSSPLARYQVRGEGPGEFIASLN